MPGTRRTPISRTPNPHITPEAIALYEKGKRFIARGKYDAPELSQISYELGRVLGVRPWQCCPLVDCVGYSEPADWMDTEREREDWFRSAEIRDQLETALRARRKAVREQATPA
jgi:hypothetical protein